MDDRQTQIREGAGLEDSRINQEFLDFLNKWSSPVLLTLAVGALVWAGLQMMQRKKVARIDQAFSELDAATQGGNPSPASLKTIAENYEGVRSVAELALLTTSDLYLNAFVMSAEPGAQMNPETGLPVNEDDVLDEDARNAYLSLAQQAAQQVLDLTEGKPGKELIAMQAMTRLAAIAESKREFDQAKSIYEQLKSSATQTKYLSLAAFAQQRIDRIPALQAIGELPEQASLAPLPGEESIGIQPELSPEQLQQFEEMIRQQAEAAMAEGEGEDQPAQDSPEDPAQGDEPADDSGDAGDASGTPSP